MEPVAVAIDSLVTSAPRVSITRTDTEFGTRLTARELAILPTFNDARLLVAFTPGARPDQIWGAASAQANQYQLDGIIVNHPGVGGDFLQPSVTWIQDLEVRGLGAGAETGNFQGGIVNYLTKSGGNTLEGQARLSYESYKMNGTNLGLAEVGSELGGRFDFDGQIRGPDRAGQTALRALRAVHRPRPPASRTRCHRSPANSSIPPPRSRSSSSSASSPGGLEHAISSPGASPGSDSRATRPRATDSCRPKRRTSSRSGPGSTPASWRRTWSEKSDLDVATRRVQL